MMEFVKAVIDTVRAIAEGKGGIALQKVDLPIGTKYPATAMPPYISGGTGNRQLYPGDLKMPTPGNPTPLTEYVTCSQVYIRFVPNASAPGGWYINSAWPQ